MDTFLYLGTLLILALLAFILYQNNYSKLALLALLIGVYIVYSHETGHTATEFKNELMNSVEEEAEDVSKNYRFDGEKITKSVK